MLFVFTGSDTKKMRGALVSALIKRKGDVVRVTDAHSIEDLRAALDGGGMFSSGKRVVVLDNVVSNAEMRADLVPRLASLSKNDDEIFVVQAELDAATKKILAKYAEKVEVFDEAKQQKVETVFALANALQRGEKKDLWVGYQREIAAGKSPESIHGVLFWAVKQQILRNPTDARARAMLATLAELPHEARRRGVELEYALEQFALTLA